MAPIQAVDYLFEMSGVPNTVMIGVKEDYTPVVRFCKSDQMEDRLDSLIEGDFDELSDLVAKEIFETDGKVLMVEVKIGHNGVEFSRVDLDKSDVKKDPEDIIRDYYEEKEIDSSSITSLVDAVSEGTPLVVIVDCETGDSTSTFDIVW